MQLLLARQQAATTVGPAQPSSTVSATASDHESADALSVAVPAASSFSLSEAEQRLLEAEVSSVMEFEDADVDSTSRERESRAEDLELDGLSSSTASYRRLDG